MLTYEVNIDSLSYCSRDRIENMLISANRQALSNESCLAFDGPGMLYQRTN